MFEVLLATTGFFVNERAQNDAQRTIAGVLMAVALNRLLESISQRKENTQ